MTAMVLIAAGLIVQMDLHAPFIDESFSVPHILRGDILEQLKTLFRVATQCAQGDGYGQANHPRAGNTYTRGVFDHIATEVNVYLRRPLGQNLTCPCCAKSNRYRLSTSYRRYYLLLHAHFYLNSIFWR